MVETIVMSAGEGVFGELRELSVTGHSGKFIKFPCRRLSKSGFNCLSKSGQVFLIFMAA
jgi:hypothetical protein